MLATEELKQEHRVIERMLAVLRAVAARADKGQGLPPVFFTKAVDFIRNFADRCHHGKEEDNLFPVLERHGISRQAGPLGVMLMEHEQGRAYVRDMDEAAKRLAVGDTAALKVALESACGYAELLKQHIEKEDNILYVMADQVLTTAEQKGLLEKFEEVERERLGEGKHQEYLQLVAELEQETGLA